VRAMMFGLAFVFACPISALAQDADVPTSFGHRGYVTRDDLAALKFAAADKDLALLTHVPTPRTPVGEPLWAYFIAKNQGKQPLGLDMRFDFVTGRLHNTTNACSFAVKPLTEGLKLGVMMRSHTWECGSGSLIDVAPQGYYVAGIDLTAWGNLRPGDYELSWSHGKAISNTVKFTVLAGHEKESVARKQPHWTLWELDRRRMQGVAKGEADQEPAGLVRMWPWWQGEFSAALGSGVGERYVTDLERLPASDALVRVVADWTLGKYTDRVKLQFTSMDPKVRVRLDSLHVYVIADVPGNCPGGEKAADISRTSTCVTPYSIEMELPSNWRTRPEKEYDVEGTFQAALLVTSKALRPPTRGRMTIEAVEDRLERSRSNQPVQIWDGLLRTELQKLTWR